MATENHTTNPLTTALLERYNLTTSNTALNAADVFDRIEGRVTATLSILIQSLEIEAETLFDITRGEAGLLFYSLRDDINELGKCQDILFQEWRKLQGYTD